MVDLVDAPVELKRYFLDVLENKIASIANFEAEKAELKLTLDALREVISLDQKDARNLKFFNDLSEFSISIALGKYNVRIELGDPRNKDLFYTVGTMLNQMAEELEANNIPNVYLKSTLNALHKAAFLCDEKKRIQYVNDKFLKLSGFSQEEIKGNPITSFINVEIGTTSSRDKLFLLRKKLPKTEIILRANPIEPSHPLDRAGTLYTISVIG